MFSRIALSVGALLCASSQVNTLEPLQFFLRYSDINEYVKAVTLGRMTLDHGSRRRLSQRNQTRQT